MATILKKIYLVCILLTAVISKTTAQNYYTSGFSFGVGMLNTKHKIWERHGYEEDHHNNGRVFFLQFSQHQLSDIIYIDVSFVFDRRQKGTEYYYNGQYSYLTEYKAREFGVLLGIGFKWFRKEWWEVSSEVNLGYHRYSVDRGYSDKYIDARIDGHLTFLKLRMGKSLGGFVQVGYGLKGLVGVGLEYRIMQ